MRDWASGGGLKIERAKEHIADFERRSAAFLNPAPYNLVTEPDPETGHTVFRWNALPHAQGGIPKDLGTIVGDAVHNLRSALDILWRQATVHRPGKPDKRKMAYFPFPKSAHELETRLNGVKEPASKSALQIAAAFKPYRTGNKNLWLLNEASALDKHEVPILVTCAFSSGILTLGPPAWEGDDGIGFELSTKARPNWDGMLVVEHGKEFFRSLQDQSLDPNNDPKFTFRITFGEGGPLNCKPVLPTLHEFLSVTEAIANAFLAEPILQARLMP